jgi:hypothetical protein
MRTNEHHPAIEPGAIVAGITLHAPMNAKRIRVLTRRKCGLFVDDDGRDELAGIEAAFFCLSLTSDELTQLFGLSQEQWDERVEDFAMSLPDGAVEEFAELFKEESETLANVSVEDADAEDEGKPTVGDQSAPPLTGSQVSSPLPLKAVSDTLKPNHSPSSVSCSTSTLSGIQTESISSGPESATMSATG